MASCAVRHRYDALVTLTTLEVHMDVGTVAILGLLVLIVVGTPGFFFWRKYEQRRGFYDFDPTTTPDPSEAPIPEIVIDLRVNPGPPRRTVHIDARGGDDPANCAELGAAEERLADMGAHGEFRLGQKMTRAEARRLDERDKRNRAS